MPSLLSVVLSRRGSSVVTVITVIVRLTPVMRSMLTSAVIDKITNNKYSAFEVDIILRLDNIFGGIPIPESDEGESLG